MRTINAVHTADADVSDADLKRMADAAEVIARRQRKHDEEDAEVVAWLKLQTQDRSLAELAASLGEDPANLAKVIDNRRKPSTRLLNEVAKRMKAIIA